MSACVQAYQEYAAVGHLADRREIATLEGRFEEIAASRDVVASMRTVAAQEGMSFGTVRRKFYAWRRGGAAALADKRRQRAPAADGAFYAAFKRYAERDTNTSRGGYDALMRDFRGGAAFDFGTWRDLWKRDFPFEPVPALCPANWTPRGCTYARMMQIQHADETRGMALAWTRQGQFAALKYVLPVIRSRVGLKVGQVVQSDDVWHNVDVFQRGVKGVFNPLEFAFYDIASGFKVVSAIKPRILVTDPKTGKETRDNLKEAQYRMAVAYLMCVVGFHRDGITLIGERGTTALRDTVLRRIADVPGYGKLFRFQTSGVKNTPAHAGLFLGNAGGNPRMKSFCECAHNVLHNATASLPGSHGRDAARLHESNAAAVKYTAEQLALAQAVNPDIIPLLRLPIVDFKAYCQYFYAVEDAVMDRTEIRLEGWEKNYVTEYRLDEASPWRDVAELGRMEPAKQSAVTAVVSLDPKNLMRQRKMSRREVWAAGQDELIRWPLADMPCFLDPRDAREATVRADGTVAFTDQLYYPDRVMRYVAQYRDVRTGVLTRLAPGTRVRFFWNPLGTLANQIWLTDEAGERTLGTMPLMQTASWADEHSIKVAMGQQQAQIAALMADTRMGGAAAGVARLAAQRVNQALVGAAKEAAAAPVTMGGARATLEELAQAGTAAAAEPEPEPEEAAAPDPGDFLAEMLAAN